MWIGAGIQEKAFRGLRGVARRIRQTLAINLVSTAAPQPHISNLAENVWVTHKSALKSTLGEWKFLASKGSQKWTMRSLPRDFQHQL